MAAEKARPGARAPAGLGPAGQRVWSRLTGAYDFAEHELVQVEMVARQADLNADLEAALARAGVVVAGAAGQSRLNAVATELRQGRLALSKLLGALALPDEDDRPMSAASLNARKAANARWARRRAVRERTEWKRDAGGSA